MDCRLINASFDFRNPKMDFDSLILKSIGKLPVRPQKLVNMDR